MPQVWSLIRCKTEAQPQKNTWICATVSFTNIQTWKQQKCRDVQQCCRETPLLPKKRL